MSEFSTTDSSKSAYHTAERKKSNLAFAFFCLDKQRAEDMQTFYAFCRLMDDIADEETNPISRRIEMLEDWKREIDSIYSDGKDLSPLGVEMKDLIERRSIPKEHIIAIIDGVMRDTSHAPFETFEDIRKYCYGVASAVGLCSIYIFGFKNPTTIQFAQSLGYALQFTNILRDVVDDARTLNRVYVPTEELKAFGVSPEDLRDPSKNPACKKLFEMMYFRAKHFFNKSRRLLMNEDRRVLAPALIMWAIYEEILERLRSRDFDIPAKPLKISKPRKIALALGAIRNSKRQAPQLASGKVAVIGGGVAGIAAAVNLCAEGFDVDLFEAKSFIGGRVASLEFQGAKLDNATHALMGCYKNFFRLVKILGTRGEDFFAPASGMDFVSASSRELVKFPTANAGKFAKTFAFLSYLKLPAMRSARNLALLLKIKFGLANAGEQESASAYLKRHKISASAIETFWEPFCVSALNTSLESASAKVMRSTLKKCILKSAEDGRLYFPIRPIADALAPAEYFLRACGSKIHLSNSIEKIEVENDIANAIITKNGERSEFAYIVCATQPDSASALCGVKKLEQTPVQNVYFVSNKKLLNADYACIVGSPLHWIFDHSKKLDGKKFLYGITISANARRGTKEETKQFIQTELSKIFGNLKIEDLLSVGFENSTLSADFKTEQMRKFVAKTNIKNLKIIGDWVDTGLPATLESAAKSAFDLKF